jgi:hypothetical protein
MMSLDYGGKIVFKKVKAMIMIMNFFGRGRGHDHDHYEKKMMRQNI